MIHDSPGDTEGLSFLLRSKEEPMQHRPVASLPRAPRKRRHLHLIDPADGAEILADRRVYSHAALTPWQVEIVMDDPSLAEYDATFRLVPNDDGGGDRVVFTLSLPETNLYPLQVHIWPNNEIQYESHVPLIVRVRPRKKVIVVQLLAHVRVVPEGVAVTYKE